MQNSYHQSQLFQSLPIKLSLSRAEVCYYQSYLAISEADALFGILKNELPWRQETVQIYGRSLLAPRLSCWMGDPGLDYCYSGLSMHSLVWHPQVSALKHRLEREIGQRFNSVLVNYYRDGQDSVAWHADDEAELGAKPFIASVSLGGVRDFQFKPKGGKQIHTSLPLAHGSLLTMGGETQLYWWHQIPKRRNAQARINLTFRRICPVTATLP